MLLENMMFKDRACPLLMLNNEHYKDPFGVPASESLQWDFWDTSLQSWAVQQETTPGIAANVSQHTNSSCSNRKL